MPIVSIESLKKNPPSNNIFVADTNFIISCSMKNTTDGKNYSDFLDLLLSKGCAFIFNFTTKLELLHIIRENELMKVFSNNHERVKLDSKILENWEKFGLNQTSESKFMVKNGFGSITEELFGKNGEKLESEFQSITKKFIDYKTYYEELGTTNSATWDKIPIYMAGHALDSSDASILNFGLSDPNFHGMISLDQDMFYCQSTRDFQIIIPDKYILGSNFFKPWQ